MSMLKKSITNVPIVPNVVKNKTVITITLLFAIIFCSCMDDEVIQTSPVDLYGSRGVFIVNEGNYLYGNSSLHYYDIDTKEVVADIFSLANGIPLGDVAYSMFIRNGKGYIVVNNSSSIHVVDANTLLLEKTITGLTSPRHIFFIDNERALVSDLYGRGLTIINTSTGIVEGKISIGGNSLPLFQHSTENLVQIGSKVYTNCWSFDNKIFEIDIQTLSVSDSLEVGVQPYWMAKDQHEKLWIVCDGGYNGNPFGHENPSLIKVNPQTLTIEKRFIFPSQTDQVGQIAISPQGDSIYFVRNHLYKMDVEADNLPENPVVMKNGRNFRAISVDNETGDIYLSDAVDFMGEGFVYRYKSNGNPVDTISSGIIPSFFCFN